MAVHIYDSLVLLAWWIQILVQVVCNFTTTFLLLNEGEFMAYRPTGRLGGEN
jgi:hypothetical protein